MRQYRELCNRILTEGTPKTDRTGTGTLSVFGHQMRFNLSEGFPLVSLKKTHFRSVVAELLWFLSGSTNVKDLQAMGCTIWDEWARPDGELGPVYGKQWRDFAGMDQIANVIGSIRTNPDSRRHIVSAWNAPEICDMALAPCHVMFQFDVTNGYLSCQVYQRSADVFLGVPFNIASYALLTHMVAQQCELEVADLVWTGGDCHLYGNHLMQTHAMLRRSEKDSPELYLHKAASIFSYTPAHIVLNGYEPHPAIKAEVAV